jgi:hypothetical protein
MPNSMFGGSEELRDFAGLCKATAAALRPWPHANPPSDVSGFRSESGQHNFTVGLS